MTTLTPSTLRLDLKCGKGSISQGEKCHKGVATKVALAVGATALAAGALALAARKPRGISPVKSPGEGLEFLSKGTQGSVWVSKNRKTVTKVARTSSGKRMLIEEARTQDKAFKAGVSTPKVTAVSTKKGTVSMENLEGYELITKGIKKRSSELNKQHARDLIDNLSKAHRANIAHGDLNSNVLVNGDKLSIIDWGQSNTVRNKGVVDVLNAIRMTDELDPSLAKVMKAEFKPIQTKFTRQEPLSVADFSDFYSRVMKTSKRSDAQRFDLKCGKGSISKGEKCHKGTAVTVTKTLLTAGAIGLGVGLFKAARPRYQDRINVTASARPPA